MSPTLFRQWTFVKTGHIVLRMEATGPVSPADEVDAAVATNVRQQREARGITQRQLAEKLTSLGWPVDNTAVARLEAGKRTVRAGQLVQLAIALDCTVNTLLESDVTAKANNAVRLAIQALVRVDFAVKLSTSRRRHLARVLEWPGLDAWAYRASAETLSQLDLSKLVAELVSEYEDGDGYDWGRRSPETFGSVEFDERVDHYLELLDGVRQRRPQADGRHREDA